MDFLNKTLSDASGLLSNIGPDSEVYANSSCEKLGYGRKWKYFFFSSLACPIILYSILAIWTFTKWIILRSKRAIVGNPNSPVLPEYLFGLRKDIPAQWSIPRLETLQKEVNKIVCCQNLTGEIIAVVAFLIAMLSFGIYVHEVSDFVPDLEICLPWLGSAVWKIDFACNLFFLLYFFLRLIASNRKVWFLSEMYTIIDYFTIAPAFVALFLNRNWSGLRFLRILYIFSIPDVLQYVGALKSRTEVRLAHLVCQLAGVVFVGAGVFHLLENFFVVIESGHSYGKFLYFTIITISTVGYGDIYCVSTLGRVFCCLFIMAALGLFASSIPDIASMFTTRYKYGGKFKLERGSHHVIVCGRIDYGIANQILENCFHTDHEVKNLNVVFLSPEDPDLEMEALLKKNFTQVDYLQGDVLNRADLERAKIAEAFACLIIANKKAEKTESEDALNIMRVISIKNAQPTTRVIVQLLHSHHQMHLFNLSSWNVFRGDTVINLSFLKMQLLAMSCEAFGFSTFVSNLLNCYPTTLNRVSTSNSNINHNDLADDYKSGCSCKVSFQRLSNFYTGMTFQSAARHVYSYLDLLLIGLFERPEFKVDSMSGSANILINPAKTIISVAHLGVFITRADFLTEKAWYFCKECHAGVKDSSEIKVCGCENKKINTVSEVNPVRKFWVKCQSVSPINPEGFSPHEKSISESSKNPYRYLKTNNEFLSSNSSNDSIATYVLNNQYWISEYSFSNALLNNGAASLPLNNHIVICVLAEADSPLVGLHELIAPLRSRSIPLEQLKEIVLLGDADYLEREWPTLRHYPRLHIAKGNAVHWEDLEAASIKTCSTCIVISAKKNSSSESEIDEVVDHDSILTTLNLKSAQRGYQIVHGTNKSDFDGKRLSILTTLKHDESLRFLDQEDSSPIGEKSVCFSRPYMAGEVLMESVLNSLTTSTYFNPLALSLIQSFVYGRACLEKDAGGQDRPTVNDTTSFQVMPLGQGIFSEYTSGTYKELVLHALHYGVVCVGLHRSFVSNESTESDNRSLTNRCVITAPAADLVLRSDDLVFVFAFRNGNQFRDDYTKNPEDNRAVDTRKVSLGILDRLSDALEKDRNLYHNALVAQTKANEQFLKGSHDF